MVATSWVVYVVFFQSKFLPYYKMDMPVSVVTLVDLASTAVTHLRRIIKHSLELLHTFR